MSLSSYSNNSTSKPTIFQKMLDTFYELLEQIHKDEVVLFLGSGSSRLCVRNDGTSGLSGQELAMEILMELNRGEKPDFSVSLTEAAEFYSACKASARGGLDRFIEARLKGLQPSMGHFIATAFPWRAVITTNYSTEAEEAYAEAQQDGFAAQHIHVIRHDADYDYYVEHPQTVPFYKPHGCITIPNDISSRMVITSQDYFESMRIRSRIYQEIEHLCTNYNTLFIGYSLNDFTFRNIFYDLHKNLGMWNKMSFSVGPWRNELLFKWTQRAMDKNFNTLLINDNFDTFMLRLLQEQNYPIPNSLAQKIENLWDFAKGTNKNYFEGFDLQQFIHKNR